MTDSFWMSAPESGIRFGQLLKAERKSRRITLVELAARSGLDDGNLSRIERGTRNPPRMRTLARILTGLGLDEGSHEWRKLIMAAARDRFATSSKDGLIPLAGEAVLRSTGRPSKKPRITLAEAAAEIERIAAKFGVRRITVEAMDGSEFSLPISKEKSSAQEGNDEQDH